ncbi:HNH endonuclease [Paenarthrobacter sp. RAF54_2]|uniref:HNH endonuclease n=1 Tax=Paenarthrobacter sp. RAF54_2 TaxID=3233061 RepID=UPI003F983F8E
MMLPPVVYSDQEQQIIDTFEAMAIKRGDYWNQATLEKLKLRIKKHYLTVQRSTCCYCRQVFPTNHARVWDTEHVVPRATHAHFMFTPLNLAAACPPCNGRKSDSQTLVNPSQVTYPTTGQDYHVIHPHFDDYKEHIVKGDFNYVPLSEKGKWTIKHCDLARFAGKEFGWPDPVGDERFESAVDTVVEGDATGVPLIALELSSSIKP